MWSAFLFVFLEITSQEILLQLWSKEILNLILFSCPHISSKQDRRREDSSPKIQGESDESFLLLLWGSGLPAAADCVELCSFQRWQEQLWLQSRCQLRDDLLWVICPSCASVPPLQIDEQLWVQWTPPSCRATSPFCPQQLLWSSTGTARAMWQQLSHIAG